MKKKGVFPPAPIKPKKVQTSLGTQLPLNGPTQADPNLGASLPNVSEGKKQIGAWNPKKGGR